MDGNYLITTDRWFVAPDGKDYQAVWGEVKVLEDSILGIKTNRNSTNWYLRIGSDTNHVIVAGCQVHYAVKCEDKPNTSDSESWEQFEGKLIKYNRPTKIYIAE